MAEKGTVLVCDDEELIRWSIREHLQGEGYRVLVAEDGQQCLDLVGREAPDLLITDLKMPVMDGLELIRRLRREERDLPVVVITAHGAVDSAIEATRLGAAAYLDKPFDLREVSIAADKALTAWRLEREVRYLRHRAAASYGPIVGASQAMQRLFDTLRRLEDVGGPTVLVAGESGTGKDLVARAIHERGPRAERPFMEVDCASLPDTLIESELFGHERGAFTDAKATKRGLFELAMDGTIFLDEIAEMALGMQAKLLRALENRTFRRVGGVSAIDLKAGVIAATNRDLAKEVREGRFREDLYYRLNVVRVDVPPLRERRDDVPALVDHFVARFNEAFGRRIGGVTGDAMARLQAYSWPGNVRELKNVIERIVILEPGDTVRLEHLPPEIRYGSPEAGAHSTSNFTLPDEGIDLEEMEKGLLLQAMERTHGNQSAAARLLGISRYALRYRLEKRGLL